MAIAADLAAGGAVNASKETQQGGFAAAVVAEEADPLSVTDSEIKMVKGQRAKATATLAIQDDPTQRTALIPAA